MEDGLLVAIFVIALWLPLLGMALHWGVVTPEQENRLLAPLPALSTNLRDLASFPDGFDSYLRDNFGFRGTLIRLQAIARVKLLGVPTSPQVTLGKDGWLFYADEYSNRGERRFPPFTPKQLDYWRRVLEARRDWLARRRIRYLFTVAPSKHTIYPEYLPDSFPRPGEEARIGQFIAYLKEHSNIEVLDLRPDLYRAKSLRQIYYKTDTHWNNYGAFVAYQSIIRELSKWFPHLQPVSESDCQVTTTNSPSGDLVKMLGLTGSIYEAIPVVKLRSPSYKTISMLPIPLPEKMNMITEREHTDLPRMVMLHNSATATLMPFLAQHFSRAVFAWPLRFDTELIESERPDVVIEEMSETHLMYDPPVDPLEVRSLKYPGEENPSSLSGPKADYNGYQDSADCWVVTGWAWDRMRPAEAIDVAIYDGNTLLAIIPADHFRDDLIQAGIGDGRHGFSYELPRSLRDGGAHSISVKVANAEFRLHNAPASLTCASP